MLISEYELMHAAPWLSRYGDRRLCQELLESDMLVCRVA
jgi:hypothetical protein